MKWQVLLLALSCASAHALHATRPLVTPTKTMARTGADGRLRAQKAKACHAQQSKDKCLQAACVYCSSPHSGVSSGCFHPLESLRMPKSKQINVPVTPLFRHTSACCVWPAHSVISAAASLISNKRLYLTAQHGLSRMLAATAPCCFCSQAQQVDTRVHPCAATFGSFICIRCLL
jgi:hypothetical protein